MADKYYERVKLRLWWKRKYVGFFNGVLASAVLCFLSCLTLSLHYNRLYEETSLYYSYGGMASIIVAIVVVAVTAINLFKRTPLPDSQAVGQMIRSSKKIFLTGNIIIIMFFLFTSVPVVLPLALNGTTSLKNIIGLYPVAWAILLFFLLVMNAGAIINLKVNGQLKNDLQNNGHIVDSVAAQSSDKIRERANAYEKKRNAAREAAGKLPKSSREYEIERTVRSWFRTVRFVLLPVLILALLIYFFAFKIKPFGMKAIERISVGDNMGYITRMLGEPYDKSDIENQSGFIESGTWKWCSNPKAKELTAKKKQLEKLTEQFETADLESVLKLTEQIMNLELEVESTPADYIIINHVRNEAVSIDLKKNFISSEISTKSLSKITYAAAQSEKYYVYGDAPETKAVPDGDEVCEINIRIYFDDGSVSNFKREFIADMRTAGKLPLSWSDEYGEHAFTLILR